jgi:phospholipase A1
MPASDLPGLSAGNHPPHEWYADLPHDPEGERERRIPIFPLSLFPMCLSLVLALSLTTAGVASGSNPSGGWNECETILDNTERLKCFDELSGRESERSFVLPEGEDREREESEGPSYLSELWELDEESRQRKYAVTPYRSNYILPVTYNSTPNQGPIREADPGKEVKHYEVEFQISFKVKLWQDVLARDVDLWMGYTQRSFWQLYDFADSSPFRETDFEPELLLNFRTDYRLLGLRGRFINVGFNHQSNGRSEPLSRSWNRVVANFGFERDSLVFLLNVWYRIPEDEADDDNPNIEDYLGYGQLNAFYLWHGHRFGLLFRNNLRFDDNRSGLQLSWSFPLLARVSGYVQYFHGYGESLLDYNASANRIGIGFLLKEW